MGNNKVVAKAKKRRVIQRADGTTWRIRNLELAKAKEHEVKLRKYGINTKQFELLFLMQKGVCAICGRPPKKYRLNVDHDHKSGRVRGLLCWRCNKFLVPQQHTSDILRKAADYLDKIFDGRMLEV